MPERGGRVRGVHQDAAERLRGEDGIEAIDLALRRLLIGVGGGEMRVYARELWAEDLARLPHL